MRSICQDLDGETLKGEICVSLKEQYMLKELGGKFIVGLKKAYDPIQIGAMRLPVEMARKLLTDGKVRFGWAA